MKIYFNNKEIDILVDTSSYRYAGIQNAHSLNLYFSSEEYIDIPVGAYCIYQGYTFYLLDPNDFKKNSSREYAYTLVMYDVGSTLGKYKYRDIVSKRLKFDYTAKPKEHLQMLVDNMNMRDTGWRVGECIEADEKLIAYNHTFCDEALRSIADTFKTEWEIDGKTKTIHLRKVEYNKDAPLPLEYGKDKGFKPGLGRSNSENSRPVSILYVQGGSQNIDPTKYKSNELLLPKNQSLVYEGRTYVTDADGLYIRRSDKTLSTVQEDSLDCSNIYPKRVGEVSSVIVSNADKNFYDFVDDSIPDNLNFEDYLIAGETMTVIFQSGMLAGKEFEVKYIHKERKFQITPQEIDGQIMPNDIYKPIESNKYAVFGIQLPDAYICNNSKKEGASWDMFREAARYLYENEDPKFTFKGEMDGIWSKKRWLSIGGKIKLGGYILFKDPQFIPEGIKIRITSIKEYVHRPYSPIIELSNVTVGTSVSSELNKIEENEVITDKNFKESIQFTKRRFRDAKETIAMLNEALLHFSGSISPISVQTMSLLVGDESLQFRFVNNKTNPVQVEHLVTYDNSQKILTAPGGILQHMTIGIDSVSSTHKVSEYKFWDMETYTSPVLTETVGYYLYAKVSKSTTKGSFLLSKNAIKLEGVSGYYHLLVGVLNSEFEEERSFVELYGFTEILPGRITTDRVISSDGKNFMDFVNNAFRVGNDANFLDFNSKGDGKLRLKESIVQSESGDESPIGCFRGTYNSSYTYYWGDEVTYTTTNGTSTYRYVNKTPSRGYYPTNVTYWIIVAEGAKGDYFEYRYAVNGSRSTPPSLSTTSINPSGWSTGMPSVGSLQYLWMTVAKKSASGSLLQNWSTPVRTTPYDGIDGKDGDPGASLVYRGSYSSSKIYYGTSKRVDAVMYGGKYYVTRADAGTFSGTPPTSTSKWNDFGAQFESVATHLLLAEYANIAGLILKNNMLISQKGTVNGVASTDYSNANFVPNLMLDGLKGQSVISGSLRSPFAYYDGSWYVGDDVTSDAERYDNLVLPIQQGGWEVALSFPWTNKCNGRRITIVNYKWGSNISQGTFNLTAPSGKYFFENGILKSKLSFSREVIELLGYGDNTTFFGWIVIGRHDIGTTGKYGEVQKVMYAGEVRGNDSSAWFHKKFSFDGTSMSVRRLGKGYYRVYFGIAFSSEDDYTVIMTGSMVGSSSDASMVYACLVDRTASYFTVRLADDSSTNDGGFIFQVISMRFSWT